MARNLCHEHYGRVEKMSRLLGFNLDAVIVIDGQCEECDWNAKSKRASQKKAAFIGGGR